MSSADDRSRVGGLSRDWLGRAAIAIAVVALILVAVRLTLAAAQPERSFWAVDFADYRTAGARVLDGEIPYAPEMLNGPFSADGHDRYRYPPPFALLVAPLAVVPADVAAWIWLGISAAGLAIGCYLAARAGGMRGPASAFAPLVVLVALAAPVYDSLRVGNVEGVQVLLIGIALAGSASVASAAVAGLGVLKVYPAVAWPATVVRDPRAALRGFGVVAIVLLVTGPLLLAAWGAYPVILANQWLGAAADDPGNLALPMVVGRIAPDLPMLATLTRLLTLGLAAALFIASIAWARRPDGWPPALLAALVAGLLVPGTAWLHYFAIFLPFVVYAWPRLALPWRLASIAVFLTLGLGGSAMRVVEEVLFLGLVVVLLAHLRPAAAPANEAGPAAGGRGPEAAEASTSPSP
jgi:hypothetical protein